MSVPVRDPELSAMQRALVAVRELRARVRQLEDARAEPIAIIGVGCRLPAGIEDATGFWELLSSGGDAVRPPPASRPELASGSERDPDAPSRAFQRDGAYLSHIDRFDAGFFGIAPREAVALDPQQRLLLETSYEALEDAGLPLDGLVGSATGVFVGAGVEDYAQFGLRSGDAAANDAYAFTGSDLSLAAGRIAYSFGLQGPALVVDTACSSSLVALHLAVASLRQGESSLALVGGVNLILTWDIGVSLCKARALAADGRCKTFDASADGYGRGEGCCVLVLKRWRDALADGDRPLALILGSAVNQDGASSGLTAPNGLAQQELLRSALRAAGVRADEIGYVEAHGTGTPLGDPIEVGALAAVLSQGRASDRPLLVGSVKTQIGHLEAAAGLAGVLKTALALQHELLPPTLHLRQLNPQIDFGGMPAAVVSEARPWPRTATRRIAGVSSFGISGTNAHAIVAEAPAEPAATAAVAGLLAADTTGTLFTLSARSERARHELIDRYRTWLRGAGRAVDLDALCREAALRRTHHGWRLAVAARSTAELCAALDACARGESPATVASGEGASATSGPVFVFDGQGGQWPRMGSALCERSPAARAAIEAFDAVLRGEAGWSVVELLRSPSDEWVTASDRAQPALTAVQIALTEHWRSWGVVPSAIVGHSAGEVAAAYAAGVLSLEDAARVARERGRFTQRTAGSGAMATVELPARELERLLSDGGFGVSVAALNAPTTTVVSGAADAVEELLRALEARSVRTRRIAVDFPAHSARMEPVLEELARALAGIQPRPATVPLWSTVRGDRARPGDCDARYWAANVRQPVQFAPVIAALLRQGAQNFIDIGPHPILALPIAQCAEAAGRAVEVVPSLRRDVDDLSTLVTSLGMLWARGESLDRLRLFGAGPRAAFALPRHPWHRERYWRDRAPLARAATASSEMDAPREGEEAGLVHRVAWVADPIDSTGATAPVGGAEGRWIVLADRSGLGRALAGELERRGGDVTLLFGADDLAGALHALLPSPKAPPARLVHLWNLDLAAIEASDGAAARDGWILTWQAASRLVQALSQLGDRRAPRTWVVTRGAQPVADRGGDRVLQAMAWSLWGSVAYELDDLAVRRVDLDPALDHERDLAGLLDELLRAGRPVDAVAHRGGARRLPRLISAAGVATPLTVRDDASYLVTGGLGGLGLAVAATLVERGARHLALVGRRAPTEAQRARVTELERMGARVHLFAADVADRTGMARLLDALAASAPPLRGVVHAAGVLEDGLVAGQREEQFARVVAAKVAGASHLHALTSGWPLDFFVLFSSVAGTLCPPGQASYAAANAGLDAIARLRRVAGLPAVSIAWGPWAEGGMVDALAASHRERLAARGLTSLDATSGRKLFAALARSREPHVVAMPLTDRGRLVRGFAFADGRPCTLLDGNDNFAATTDAARDGLLDRLRAVSRTQRLELLEAEVGRRVAAALGLTGPLRTDLPFRQLGMDSLMAVMVRNVLAAALERTLPATILFDHPTVAALARELLRSLDEQDTSAAALAHATPGVDADLALLAALPESELADAMLATLESTDQEVQS